MLALIAAVARNGVIGRDNAMPWHLPADLAHFKRTTLGRPVIMGRKTFESIGKPLPGRRNIVVTRNPAWQAPGTESAASLADALARCDGEDIFVIGGATLYREALPLAARIHLTEIDADIAGDTHFPALSGGDWREISRAHHPKDERNPYDLSFIVLERR